MLEITKLDNKTNKEIPNRQKYDADKWKKIMDTTQMNYSNMLKRLSRQNSVSNFILIYYSIFLIVNTLTCKYFCEIYNSIIAEYCSIILSVIMLAYSLINNNANYSSRINNIEKSLNQIKNLKRNIKDESIESTIEQYNAITDKTEKRSDVDFFLTLRQLGKGHDINISFCGKVKYNGFNKSISEDIEEQVKVMKGYLAEIFVPKEWTQIVSEYLWYTILFIIPILIVVLCLTFK